MKGDYRMRKEIKVIFVFVAVIIILFLYSCSGKGEEKRDVQINSSEKIYEKKELAEPATQPSGEQKIKEKSANKAVRVNIVRFSFTDEVAKVKAPSGKVFLILETKWENIHPKQKIEKSKLEGKIDHTMGVKKLMQGREKKKEEYVDADVAYMVRGFVNHAYILADGKSFSMDKTTAEIPEGINPKGDFILPKFGDTKKVKFVFLLPGDHENLAFNFFDYNYGHILIPIKGDPLIARGKDQLKGKFLGEIKSDFANINALEIRFSNEYKGKKAPDNWHYALVDLAGKSLSGDRVKDIVQIKPESYVWVSTEEGYLYYSCGGSTTDEGFIRFTPEVYQQQSVAFLLPNVIKNVNLGIRIQNQVFGLNLSKDFKKKIPNPIESHQDGDVMEVMVYGIEKRDNKIILNLGIQSLAKSGVEIQRKQQFILIANEQKIYLNDNETDSSLFRPPSPFVIPPGFFVRFELIYTSDISPEKLYFRGFKSEKYFILKF